MSWMSLMSLLPAKGGKMLGAARGRIPLFTNDYVGALRRKVATRMGTTAPHVRLLFSGAPLQDITTSESSECKSVQDLACSMLSFVVVTAEVARGSRSTA